MTLKPKENKLTTALLCSLSANIKNRRFIWKFRGLTLKWAVLGSRRAESERGLRGGQAQGAGGWCRVDWWPPGGVWDKRKTHRLGPRRKNLGEGNARGLGLRAVLPSPGFKHFCVCVSGHRLCWAHCRAAFLWLREWAARPLWGAGSSRCFKHGLPGTGSAAVALGFPAAPRHVGLPGPGVRFFTAKPPGSLSLLVFLLFGPI